MLANKKVLFISVKFFGYEELIKKELEALGAEVDWFDERPSNSFLAKAILRVKKRFYLFQIVRYYRALIAAIRDRRYDYFLLIKGETCPRFFIEYLKKQNPKMRSIFFAWDSLRNSNNCLEVLDLFDERFTFDPSDALKHNIRHRPLFFAECYADLAVPAQQGYDLAFIGTLHSDRYLVIQNVRNCCERYHLNFFVFYFLPSRILFWLRKLRSAQFRHFSYAEVSFSRLNHQKVLQVYGQSKAILDIHHPWQQGLTIRSLEALGAGRKLITTNKTITQYPFYHPDNVLVVDRHNIVLDAAFLDRPAVSMSPEMKYRLSLKGWILEIFGFDSFQWM